MLAIAVAMLAASGIEPHSRVDWLLENALPAILLVGLVVGWRYLRLSASAYGAILALLAIHELGAHYTYAKVPYEAWAQALADRSLNNALGWDRNQYDRLVHLSYGVLFCLPLREVLQRCTPLRGMWLALLALNVVLSTSAMYELIEWVGGQYLGEDQAKAFLATQKDPWDAQKDMALAVFGACMTQAALQSKRWLGCRANV
ncbi:Inner membrane protein YjdF [compost metagenome]